MDTFSYRIIMQNELARLVQAHVFARAYRDAWIALHAQAPSGTHTFDDLGIAIEFAEPVRPLRGIPA